MGKRSTLMEEELEGGQNRLFVILAIALIGLLVLGLLGVGGVFIIRQNIQEQDAASKATPTLFAILPNPSPTPTEIPRIATQTPAPTPTNTPVVSAQSGQEAASSSRSSTGQGAEATALFAPAATRTPVAGAAAAGAATVPETGVGGLEAVLLGMGLTLVLFVARRLRMSA
jgi:cytoskeletal protein RodZ